MAAIPDEPAAEAQATVATDAPQQDVVAEQPTDPSEPTSPSEGIDFVTLGMFIIDDIDFLPPKSSVKDILGGAGTYSALGARLFSPPPQADTVGWIVDKGSDFPENLELLIKSWQTSALLRETPDRLTTRGWNGYDEHQNRKFAYMTPKKRLTADDLDSTLLASRSFHLICSPDRCRELVLDIKSRRHGLSTPEGTPLPKPIFIWEPVPDLCTPDQLLACTNTLPLIDICSPNHSELAGFMGDDGLDPETGEISTRQVERNCEQLLASMPLQSFSLVVRCGEKGCYLARNGGRKRKPVHHPGNRRASHGQPAKQSKPKKPSALLHGALQPDTDMFSLFAGLLQDSDGAIAREEIEVDPGVERWIPAYHRHSRRESTDAGAGDAVDEPATGATGEGEETNASAAAATADPETKEAPEEAEKEVEEAAPKKERQHAVVDPTGGGNTFLGGLGVALARGRGLEEAAAWGSVAASFAIEQVGLPELGVDEKTGRETWNGVVVDDRFDEFRDRLAFSI